MTKDQPEPDQQETANKKRKLEHRDSIIQGRQVKIKLAGHSQEYDVNLGLLRKHSAFFAKAFDDASNMKEAVEGCIELHEVESDTLETFIYWVNEHVIQLPDGSEFIIGDNFSKFVDLYNFADVYDTRELRNDILKILCCGLPDRTLSYSEAGKALHQLRSSSGMYRALMALAHVRLDLAEDEVVSQIYDYFPGDAVKVLIKNLATRNFEEASSCNYELFVERAEGDSG